MAKRMVSKPTKKPPVTALGKNFDPSLENPRAYLKGGASFKEGYSKIEADLDPFDKERNPIGGVHSDEDGAEDQMDQGRPEKELQYKELKKYGRC